MMSVVKSSDVVVDLGKPNDGSSSVAFVSDVGRKPTNKTSLTYNSSGYRAKFCAFCADDTIMISYRNPEALSKFVSAGGNSRILPARITGVCARHQRVVSCEIKKARELAIF